MNKTLSKYILFGGVIVIIPLLLFTIKNAMEADNLPAILGERTKDENGEWEYHTIAPFEVTNQDGESLTSADYNEKLYIANFFFTSCPVICPRMTEQINDLYQDYAIYQNELAFISFSIDPARDSVSRLKNFADRFEIDYVNWDFVRTDKETVYQIARNDFLLTALAGTEEANDFIHSEYVTLIDAEQRIRGYYDLSEEEDVAKIKSDLDKLLNYYFK
ncbi:MAG: SCO family protein [Chitinophagales bacterium]